MTEGKDDSSDRLTQLAHALKQLATARRAARRDGIESAMDRVFATAAECGLFTPDEAVVQIQGKLVKLDLRDSEVSAPDRFARILSLIAVEFPKIWPEYLQWRRDNVQVEPSFEKEYSAPDRVVTAAQFLLWDIASALRASGPWEPVLRAFEGLKGTGLGLQERQARAVEKCRHALDAWAKLDRERRRRRGERKDAHELRLKGVELRTAEIRIAKVLILGLRAHEPLFVRAKRLTNPWVRETLATGRSNMSPYLLLHQICVRAEIWGAPSEHTLRQAVWAQRKKRQPDRT